MSSLTFTVVVNKSRKARTPQRTTSKSGTKVSSNWSRRTTRPQQPRNAKKTFCKVCFDDGKDEQCYTSHFVKDRPGPNGKIVCPTLLSTECRYCKESGHFKSHCPALAQRKSQPKRAPKQESHNSWLSKEQLARVEERVTVVKATKAHQKEHSKHKAVATSGSFQCLGSDDEEEEMSYERPSIIRPRSPQGYWGGKPIVNPAPLMSRFDFKQNPNLYDQRVANNSKPTVTTVTAKKTQPTHDLSLQCDEESRPLPKTSTNKASRSVEEIEAEIKETQEELDAQENSTNWADACDTDDLEEKLEELGTELKAAHTQLKGQKDTFGRPCADDSAW